MTTVENCILIFTIICVENVWAVVACRWFIFLCVRIWHINGCRRSYEFDLWRIFFNGISSRLTRGYPDHYLIQFNWTVWSPFDNFPLIYNGWSVTSKMKWNSQKWQLRRCRSEEKKMWFSTPKVRSARKRRGRWLTAVHKISCSLRILLHLLRS